MKQLTDYQCLCNNCGCVRTFTAKVKKRNRESNCLECSRKLRHKPKGRFRRICDTCGDIKISDRPIRPTTCLTCSQKRIGKILIDYRTSESYGGKTSYHYFCRYCPSVRVISSRRKTSTCIDCSRKYEQNKKIDTIYFDLGEMMYKVPVRRYRVCKHCGDTKEVSCKSKAVVASCNKCKFMETDQKKATAKRKKTLEANGNSAGRKSGGRNLKPRTTHYSQEAIDKVKEENRKHREAQAKPKPKNKVKRTEEEQRKWEQEQIEKFVASNKVIQLEDNKLSDSF